MKESLKKAFKNFITIFAPIAVVIVTVLVYLVSRGYRFDTQNREIEKTGVLAISSSPRGAYITIDDEYITKTPKAIAGFDKGEHDVKIDKEGYWPWTGKIKVLEEQSVPIYAVLFPKNPEIEIIYPEDKTDTNEENENTETSKIDTNSNVDQIFFGNNKSIAVFTQIKDDKLAIFTYPVNQRFWDLNVSTEKVAEFPIPQDYEIRVSPNSRSILFEAEYEETTESYLLGINSDKSEPEEIPGLKPFSETNPVWTRDSKYVIFTKKNELRSYNSETLSVTILSSRNEDSDFVWTSDESGHLYIANQNDTSLEISRTTGGGSNKDTIMRISDAPAEISEIAISPDEEYMIVLGEDTVTIYTFDEEVFDNFSADSPKFLGFSNEAELFAYTENGEDLDIYRLEIEDGDPIHEIGNSRLFGLEDGYDYSNFSWHPKDLNILFTKENSEKGNTAIQAIDIESLDVFTIYTKNESNNFAIGSSGEHLITLCEDGYVCKLNF